MRGSSIFINYLIYSPKNRDKFIQIKKNQVFRKRRNLLLDKKQTFFKYLKSLKSTLQLFPLKISGEDLQKIKAKSVDGIRKESFFPSIEGNKEETLWCFLLTSRFSDVIPDLDYERMLEYDSTLIAYEMFVNKRI